MSNGGQGADELWADFPLDPRTPAHVDLRASDADRDRIAAVLGGAYADGRLDREELDERSSALLATRTLGGLPPLVEDLLAPATTASPTTPGGVLDLTTAGPADLRARAEQEWESQRRGAFLAFLGPTLICWVVYLATMAGGFPWPLIVTAATGVNALRTLLSRREIVDAALERLERRQAMVRGPSSRGDRSDVAGGADGPEGPR